MRTLLIACGNPLRGDDGAAHEVLRLIAPAPDRATLTVHQLTPELAQEMAGFDRVLFLDADVQCGRPVVEPVPAWTSRSPLTHAANPAEILALSSALFGFGGEAYVCRIPARDFAPREALGPDERRMIDEVAGELERFLACTVSSRPRAGSSAKQDDFPHPVKADVGVGCGPGGPPYSPARATADKSNKD